MKKLGDPISESGVTKVLAKMEVQEIIKKERSRLAELIPNAVNNYEHWVKNAKMFHDRTDKDIAYRATKDILGSHGMVTGQVADQVKVIINQTEVFLSPVVSKMLEGFMGSLSGVKPAEVTKEVIDVEFVEDTKAIPENTDNLGR